MAQQEYAVVAEGLRKHYGGTVALDGLDLTVGTGTVHGLLGPNGAGKTTAVRILATLLRFDSGRASVAGFDLTREPEQIRARIGLTGQHAAVDEILSGRKNLELFGRLFHLRGREARRRAGQLLEQFDLTDVANKAVGHYSGGMRRRLDLAASLVVAPRVLFLDEPTTGLDPRSRNSVWEAVRTLVRGGTTVLLTTHYLEEADHLADRVSLIDRGRLVAEGSPGDVKNKAGGDRIEVVVHDGDDLEAAAGVLRRFGNAPPETDPDLRRSSVPVTAGAAALTDAVRALHEAGIAVEDITLRRPTLDEAFLHFTGHAGEREVAA